MPRLTITIDGTPHTRAIVPSSTAPAEAAALQAQLDALAARGELTPASLDAALGAAWARLWAERNRRD